MANPVPKTNLSVYKNSKYTHRFDVLDDAGVAVDLTGYTALLDMRAATAADPALYEATELDDLTVDVSGFVTLAIPATTLEAWTFAAAQYDLVVLPAGVAADAVCVARGTVTVYPHITNLT